MKICKSRDGVSASAIFDDKCTACSRLAQYLRTVRKNHPGYYAKPVPSFGAARAQLLIVGLAPGLHGANRTGRPFTGDYAGVLLYRTLHRFGFASRDGSDDPKDGLRLIGCRIANAVKCVPPQNRPEPDEIRRCNHYLAAELAALRPRAVLALGAIAHRAVLLALGSKRNDFAHGASGDLETPWGRLRLFDCYHCSRYNTNTRRLTPEMFEAVFRDISAFLSA